MRVLRALESCGATTFDAKWDACMGDVELVNAIFFPYTPRLFDEELMRDVAQLKNLRIFGIPNCITIGLSGSGQGRIQFGDVELKYLMDLRRLEEVYLDGSNVTDAGLQQLASHPSIKFVCVAGTLVTDAGIAAFKQRRPDCHVIRGLGGGTYNRALAVYYSLHDGQSLALAADLPVVRVVSWEYDRYGFGKGICNDDLKVLPKLKELEYFYLSNNKRINDEAIEYLLDHPSLKMVCLSATSVTDEGREKLASWYQERGREFDVDCGSPVLRK